MKTLTFRRAIHISLALLVHFAFAPQSWCNVLLNGSFESPSVPPIVLIPAAADSWQRTGTEAYVLNGRYGPAQDGVQYLGIKNGSTLSQTFLVNTGGTYQLTWFDSTEFNGPDQTAPYVVSVRDSADAAIASASFDANNVGGIGVWVPRSIEVTFTNPGSYTLSFLGQSGAFAELSLIDDVSLTAGNITLNNGGVTKLEVVARDTALGMANQIEDLFPTALPFSGSQTATSGGSFSTANYELTQEAFTVTSSGTRVGQLDSRANVQPTIYFSVASDTTYSISGALAVSDPGSTAKFAELSTQLTDVDSSEVLYYSNQGSFGVVDLALQLGGLVGNAVNELQGSATGVLLAGHRYKLSFGSSIYAANSGDPASFTGNFSITFGSVAPNNPPLCNAGAAQVKEANGALTAVTLDASLSADPDGDDLEFEWSVAVDSGATISDASAMVTSGYFPVGPTLVTLTVSDGKGGVSVCDVLITIQDTTPPVVVCTTDKISLWPPDHSIQPVSIVVQAADLAADPETLSVQCTVSSNESDNTTADGNSIGDVAGQDGYLSAVPISLSYNATTKQFSGVVNLRAERAGGQTGRVYSILCRVVDQAGNTSTASCVVVVPHNRRRQ
jgi:hypothetical protein